MIFCISLYIFKQFIYTFTNKFLGFILLCEAVAWFPRQTVKQSLLLHFLMIHAFCVDFWFQIHHNLITCVSWSPLLTNHFYFLSPNHASSNYDIFSCLGAQIQPHTVVLHHCLTWACSFIPPDQLWNHPVSPIYLLNYFHNYAVPSWILVLFSSTMRLFR